METIRAFKLRHRLGHDLTNSVVLVPSLRWKAAIERRLAAVLPEDNRPRVQYQEPGLRGRTITEWIVDDVEARHG